MISAIPGATSAYGSSMGTKPGNELGRDAFLRLLITQLRYQDPLQSVDDKEFIAQLAQFSSLEQMQLVNSTLSPFIQMMGPFMQNQTGFWAASWLGRTVTALDPSPPVDGNGMEIDPEFDQYGNKLHRTITAEVNSVRFTEEGPLLTVRVTQKEWNTDTGEYENVQRDKEIPLANVLSVS